MERFIYVGLALVVVLLVVFGIDIGTADEVRIGTGTVVEKVYTPSSTRIGHGTTIDSKGNPGTVTTVDTEPERWTVIVSFEGGTFSNRVDAAQWATFERGDTCDVFEKRGRMANYGYVVR